jgi:SnoaL-like domain
MRRESLLQRFTATLSAHDIAAFAALFAEDYVSHQTSAAAPPPPAGKSPKQATTRAELEAAVADSLQRIRSRIDDVLKPSSIRACRRMPWTSPRSLTDDQVSALTAYILAQNSLIDAKPAINARTLPKVQMPNRNGFYPALARQNA